ncbi:Endonuclease/exonuclease/phosphatase [Ephemerocybe angulata]|uniref:Endonuclease/exonuclease/phosphatase n=1 Tax=Ephemerocybe angulata TaxID=980116 RepID=A0A8H6HXR8_9AGAR|nr:Endonuclease/exonuclease/phosphatase [Tulosesus angulatus]
MADPFNPRFPKPSPEGPFIPPDLDLDEPPISALPMPELASPIIPNTLHSIRAYRYRSSRDAWKHVPNLSTEEVRDLLDEDEAHYSTTLRIVTWNVDFMTEHAEERLIAALRHIERDVLMCNGDAPFEPACICLQEVRTDMLPVILEDQWIRNHFAVTPISVTKWPEHAGYGNVTLVSRALTVVKCEIMHYGQTEMGRAALAVYVMMSEPEPSAANAVVCVVNTHLESLPQGAIARPRQMELASRFLKQPNVRGGVVVGDMNALGPGDSNLPMDCGLRDVWREGSDKDKKGHTWGYQGQNKGPNGIKYPAARLDKILYLPRRAYRMDPLERVGVDVKVKGVEGEPWVSDHYGLATTLRLVTRRNST